jgi:outer membrane protein, adhesin transport system
MPKRLDSRPCTGSPVNAHKRRCPWRVAVATLGLNVGLLGSGYAQNPTTNDALQSSLSRLVEQAISSHPSVHAKWAELGGSQAGLDAAKWQYFPSLSVQTERANKQANQTTGPSSTTLRLQQNLWTGGRIESGVKNAQSRQQSAQHALQETRVHIAMRTVEAWQSLLTALGRQQAIEKQLSQLERLHGMISRRVEQQISPAIDAQLMRARVAQAQSEQLTVKTTAETARQRLVQWVGSEPLSGLPPVDQMRSNLQAALPHWPPDLGQRLESAVITSPSLLRYEADTNTAREEIGQKQAELWPSVYARLDRQYNGNGVLGSKTVDNTVYLGLQYTTGAGLTVRSQVEEAQARLQSLTSDRETLRRQIKESYDSEWRDYQANRERIDYARLVQSSNDALFDSYTRLFVAGRRSWLELLNVLREQSTADQTLTDLLALQQASHYRLGLYLGELPWQTARQP